MDNATEQLKVKTGEETYILHPNYDEFAVIHIEGLSPADVDINLMENGSSDGAKFNSAYVKNRNIIIYLIAFGENESIRKKMYRIFPQKKELTLFYKNSVFDVQTDCYVESIVPTHYKGKEMMQISLLCPDSYLEDVNEMDFTLSVGENTIENDGEEVGFKCIVTIANVTPELNELNVSEKSSWSGLEIMKKRVLFPLSESEYDPEAQEIEVFVDDALTTGYTIDFVTYESGNRDLHVSYNTERLKSGNVVKMNVFHITDVPMHYEESQMPVVNYYEQSGKTYYEAYYDKPDWYDETQDTITMVQNGVQLVKGEAWNWWVSSRYPDKIEIDHNATDSPYIADKEHEITMTISGIRQNQKIIDVSKNVVVSLPKEVFLPLAQHTSNDLVRVFENGRKLTGWTEETVDISDGTQETCLHIRNTGFSGKITMQVVSSTSGADVSEYTDQQVDEGLKVVDNFSIENTTTGEKLTLDGVKLNPNDRINISTVYGEISVENVETGENLMYAVSGDSDYPKLTTGENTIVISADTSQDLISAELTAKKLYGGV